MNQNEEGILFFEMCDERGRVIAHFGNITNLPDVFTLYPKENFLEGNLRNVYRVKETGESIRFIVDQKHEFFQGRRAIQRTCNVYFSFLPKFKLIQNSQRQSFEAVVRRFAHNLIKFQKRFKDNFNNLIPDKSRGRPYSELKEEVQKMVENDIETAVDKICQMSHRAVDLDAQIETLRIIAGFADNTGTALNTNIKKAIYRITNPFTQELRERDINIKINIEEEDADQHRIKVVHGLFNTVMWQLFDNICKYTLDGTDVEIGSNLSSEPQRINITMISVTIEDDETESIFLENKQGKNVGKKKIAKMGISQGGTGIGLYTVQKALSLMKAKIKVTNLGHITEKNGIPYSRHSFLIEF